MTPKTEGTLSAYFDLMNANGADHAYRSAVKLGILDRLKEGPLDSSSLASACELSPEPLRLLLDILEALQVVRSQDGYFSVTPLGRLLIEGPYRNLGDPYLEYTSVFIKTGKPLEKMDRTEESEKKYQVQARALGWMLKPAADEAARLLESELKKKTAIKILDVGAGSAVWSLAVANLHSGSKVTAVDWPGVLAVAESAAVEVGLGNRFSKMVGNFHEVDFPQSEFDLAILGNVAHLETPEGLKSLFSKIHRSLKEDGKVVIFDIFPGQTEGKLSRTLYALGLALRTEKGRVHSAGALNEILDQTGYRKDRVISIRTPPFIMGMLCAGKKG